MGNVKFLACTIPDWPLLIKTCKETFGESPTRELDKRNLEIGSPATYAMVIETINDNSQAAKDLTLSNLSLNFIHLTVSIDFDRQDVARRFNTLISCPSIWHENKVIFCASLRQLRDLVNLNDKDCLKVLNSIYQGLCGLGFKTLFGAKKGCNEDTFQLFT